MNVVVGAGVSGATVARLLADKGEKVLVIDQKPHIGGNCYDYYDENGICVHKYGTHIFHTDLESVWKFVGRFTDWYPYMHKVLGMVDGHLVPIPFNLNSIHKVFPQSLAERLESKLLERFGFNKKVPILELRQANDPDLDFLAGYIYNKVFLIYTMKQWGLKPEEVDPGVTARVPVYVSRDDRYFQNRWQGIPSKGYTAMIKKMLDHENIELRLNTSWKDIEDQCLDDRVFYTGSVDLLMDRKLGDLPYRSIRLDFKTYKKEYFQSVAVVNYPENYDFTRIGEYKYFLDDRSRSTVVSFEYSSSYEYGKNEPYYPIKSDKNLAMYDEYVKMAKTRFKELYFLGRLGDYKYYDMDKAIDRAIHLVNSL
ncbi:UDP-galactopyranose mutase [Succinimonas sp.]|uniref:UDP-galactopyranose mutase n=1 Tax=Succinimonas sp. TaxID=1936151 RepID=UPI003866578F